MLSVSCMPVICLLLLLLENIFNIIYLWASSLTWLLETSSDTWIYIEWTLVAIRSCWYWISKLQIKQVIAKHTGLLSLLLILFLLVWVVRTWIENIKSILSRFLSWTIIIENIVISNWVWLREVIVVVISISK
jgi:hypothetical protein